MSALGQKRTCAVQNGMSAIPPIADMCGAKSDAAKCQKRTLICSLDYLVSNLLDMDGHLKSERFGSLKINQ